MELSGSAQRIVPPAMMDLSESAQRVEISAEEWVLETAKRVLKKRTYKKFRLLTDLVIDSEVLSTVDILQGVTRLIFEKAVMEPDLRHMYAILCSNIIEEIHRTVNSVQRILINCCQGVFECTDNLMAEIRKLVSPGEELNRIRLQRMVKALYIGNICFIGELVEEKIFADSILYAVLQEVLEHGNNETWFEGTKVKAICGLFDSIGERLDERPYLDSSLERLRELSVKPHIEPRLKLMLCNLLDRRDKKLVAAPKEHTPGDNTRNSANPDLAPPSNPYLSPGIPSPAVKTRICNKYNTIEGCRLGDKCFFAHGMEELGKQHIPFRQDEEANIGAWVTAKVTVAASIACVMAESGGWKVKNIGRRTGAKLSITDHDLDTQLKIVELEGTFHQVMQASTIVRKLIVKIIEATSLSDAIVKDGSTVKEMVLDTSKSSSTSETPNFPSTCSLQSRKLSLSEIVFLEIFRCERCEVQSSRKSNSKGQVCEQCSALKVETAALMETKLRGSAPRVELSDKEWVLETTKRLLDKQTPKKFWLLKDIVIDSKAITTIDILQDVTNLIYEKAILEPDFSPMYVQLFHNLYEEIPSFPSETMNTFGYIFANCWKEVTECTDILMSEMGKLTGPDQELSRAHLERTMKARYAGNICLIGELFKENILPEKTVYAVIQKLLENGNDETFLEGTKIEAICLLFNSIGNKLDGRRHFASCFEQLKELAARPQIESRWKLMLCDILDRRDRKLVTGHKEYSPGNNETLNWDNPTPAVKTEICNKYIAIEGCGYGDKCQFAHGIMELGKPIRRGRAANTSIEAWVTAKVTVAASTVPAVTGSGGWKAKDIFRRTGAKVSITDHDSDTEQKNIVLEGTFDQVMQASTIVKGLIVKVGDNSIKGGSDTKETCH